MLKKCRLKKIKMAFELKPYLAEKQALINDYLKKILLYYGQDRELVQAMAHSLMAGGKRLRPILCMAAAGVIGKNPLIALPPALAIEMIHTYSLIHDDLPAMDDDDLRRGLPTCHTQFSEATAILAGDALLTQAFSVISQPRNFFDIYPEDKIRLQLVGKIASAAGTNGMVEGQMLDMQAQTSNCHNSLEHLKKIHSLKTGKMIRVSVESGALSANASSLQTKKLLTYADKIGLAFQVVDDILNIEGNPEVMGKASGSDILNDKMTFPAIIGLEDSKRYARQLVDQALEALDFFKGTATEPLKEIANYIVNRDR